jgi:hypothetical protein
MKGGRMKQYLLAVLMTLANSLLAGPPPPDAAVLAPDASLQASIAKSMRVQALRDEHDATLVQIMV